MNTTSTLTAFTDILASVRSACSPTACRITKMRQSRRTMLLAGALAVMLWASVPGVSLAQGFVTPARAGHTPGELTLHAGLATMPLAASGLRDAHLSDWQACGLGDGGACPEGRVALPLAAGNASGARFGLRAGATFWLSPKLGAVAEVTLVAGGLNGAAATLGVDYVVLQGRGWHLSAAPRLGFITGLVSFGAVEQLGGYQSPVITENGDISDGDQLNASMSGWLAGAGAVYDLKLTSRIALRVDIGFQYGSFGALKVSTKEVTVDLSSPAIVNPGASSDRANMSPSGSATGLYGSVGVVYRL